MPQRLYVTRFGFALRYVCIGSFQLLSVIAQTTALCNLKCTCLFNKSNLRLLLQSSPKEYGGALLYIM